MLDLGQFSNSKCKDATLEGKKNNKVIAKVWEDKYDKLRKMHLTAFHLTCRLIYTMPI